MLKRHWNEVLFDRSELNILDTETVHVTTHVLTTIIKKQC